jgi:hypothetical protein
MNSVPVQEQEPGGQAGTAAPPFNFRWQCGPVSRLLDVCVRLLPGLPTDAAGKLEEVLRDFEQFGVPTAWSVADVDMDDEHGLSDEQKRAVIDRFAKRSADASDSDWSMLSMIVDEVVEEDAQSPA